METLPRALEDEMVRGLIEDRERDRQIAAEWEGRMVMETEKLPDVPEAPEPVEEPATEGDEDAEEDPSAEPAAE